MKKHQSGFSLVEILIAIGVVSLIGMTLASLTSNLNSFLRSAENKSAEINLITELSQITADKNLCIQTLNGAGRQNLNTSDSYKLKLKLLNGNLVQENSTVYQNLKIKQFFVNSFSPSVDSITPGFKKTSGSLWIQTEDINQKTSLRKLKTIGLINFVYNSTTNEITECFGTSINAQSTCESLGFEWITSANRCRQPPAISCADLNGEWNGTRCSLGLAGKSCPSNQIVSGFDSSGNLICDTKTVVSPPILSPPVATNPGAPSPPATITGYNCTCSQGSSPRGPGTWTHFANYDKTGECCWSCTVPEIAYYVSACTPTY